MASYVTLRPERGFNEGINSRERKVAHTTKFLCSYGISL